ncbi:TIGR04222 domain-containing membrane protein [Acrocarpospora sp. B8E8]|uniref:TIGR04222 domain-containing membrane protein n=1 Tax=Acrocarpospora sp. B8E8 TaxID=3153572 RepID=UPI00325E2046
MELVLLVSAIVIAVLVFSVASAVSRELRRVRSRHALGGPPPDVYELAYLAGGPRRTVNTAIAMLSAQGKIRVARGGRVTTVAGASGSREAVEQELLDLAAVPGGRTAGEVRQIMAQGPALIGLMHRLIGRGYMVQDAALTHGRVLNRGLGWFVVLSGLNWVISVVALATDSVPVSVFNILALVAGAFVSLIGLGLHQANRTRLRNLLTNAGYQVLSTAKLTHRPGSGTSRNFVFYSDHHPGHANDNAFAYAAVGGAVALYGLGEFNSPDAAEIAREDENPGSSGYGCAAGACGGGGGGSSDSSSWGSEPGGFGGGDFGGGSSDSGGGSSCGGGGCGGGCGGGG